MKYVDYSPLLLATIQQAVEDWRYLCQGNFQTRECNFEELEHFFTHDCDTYLLGTSLTAERILKQLRKERAASGM